MRTAEEKTSVPKERLASETEGSETTEERQVEEEIERQISGQLERDCQRFGTRSLSHGAVGPVKD
jgi:hypothetical protein